MNIHKLLEGTKGTNYVVTAQGLEKVRGLTCFCGFLSGVAAVLVACIPNNTKFAPVDVISVRHKAVSCTCFSFHAVTWCVLKGIRDLPPTSELLR